MKAALSTTFVSRERKRRVRRPHRQDDDSRKRRRRNIVFVVVAFSSSIFSSCIIWWCFLVGLAVGIHQQVVDGFAPPPQIITTSFHLRTTSSARRRGGGVVKEEDARFEHQRSRILRSRGRNNGFDKDEDDDEEWRTVRARLVRNGLPSISSTLRNDNDNNNIVDDDDKEGIIPSQKKRIIEEENNSRAADKSRYEYYNYAHECTPLVEVGSILVSIPTRDLCQALEQQYWHKAVVLITEVANDIKNGEDEEIVPENQLAQGTNRGRWSYRGILLNRFTDLVLYSDDDETEEEQQQEETIIANTTNNSKGRRIGGWNVHRGGDLLGLNSSSDETQFTCLYHHHLGHTTTDPNNVCNNVVSKKLVGDLSFLSLTDAQQLLLWKDNNNDSSKTNMIYNPDDFLTYGGFCSWRPGQLEVEMGQGREEWRVIAVDDRTIIQELQQQMNAAKKLLLTSKCCTNNESQHIVVSRGLVKIGTTMWSNFLSMINISESTATERLPPGQLAFYDSMLQVWSEDSLLLNNNNGSGGDNKDEDDDDDDSSSLERNDSSNRIGPGTLLRAKLPVSNDMLLYEQEFIRSLILVLEETEDATVGILLNHPLAAGVECVEGQESSLPLRYGGPTDVPSWKDGTFLDDDEDGGDDDDEMYEGFLDYQNGQVNTGYMIDDDIADVSFDDDEEEEDAYDDDDDDESSFLWIHRDVALGALGPKNGGGTRLGTSDVWLINENDAVKYLQSGLLCLQDTMIFSGVCVWEKGENLGACGGGLREQVDALDLFEIIVPTVGCNNNDENYHHHDHHHEEEEAIEKVWDILSKYQNVLMKETLETNVEAAILAWESCNDSSMDTSSNSSTTGNHGTRNNNNTGLSDAALKAWVGVNLLGDPLGTLVEVRKPTKQQ